MRRLFLLPALILAVCAWSGPYNLPSPIFSIHVYATDGIWAYDDPSLGVYGEALDVGQIVQYEIPGATSVTLSFASHPFANWQIVVWYVAPNPNGGAYYQVQPYATGGPIAGTVIWLCKHVTDYFGSAPPDIYARVTR